jgi:hypothetical protein
MKKVFGEKEGIFKIVIVVAISMAFVFGTAMVTYVQAATQPPSSGWVQIYPEQGEVDPMTVELKIHRYSFHKDFAIFHYLLRITNGYEEDIFVHEITAEAWSDMKGGPTSTAVMYGSDTRTNISIPALETDVIRLNHKAQNHNLLIQDDSVYAYAYIAWRHGTTEYTKSCFVMIDAEDYWHQLFP